VRPLEPRACVRVSRRGHHILEDERKGAARQQRKSARSPPPPAEPAVSLHGGSEPAGSSAAAAAVIQITASLINHACSQLRLLLLITLGHYQIGSAGVAAAAMALAGIGHMEAAPATQLNEMWKPR
jgi:hypothetical protein